MAEETIENSDEKKEKESVIGRKLEAIKAVSEKDETKKTISFLREVYTFVTLSNREKLEFLLDLAKKLFRQRKDREDIRDMSEEEREEAQEKALTAKEKEKKKSERKKRRRASMEKLQDLKKIVIGTVVSYITVLEPLTKKACYCLCPCDIYPKVPDDLIDYGINIPASKLDFFCLFSTDPDSNTGRLLYNAGTNTVNHDVNVELYKTINSLGTQSNKGQWSPKGRNLLSFQYVEDGDYTYPSSHSSSLVGDDVWELDIINVKIHSDWRNKPMNLFMGDLITSFKILNLKQLFADAIDIIFNSLSKRDASTECLRNKEAAMAFTDKINNEINDDSELEINDSFFEFSSAELLGLEESIEKRKKGIMTFTDCETTDVEVSFDTMEGIMMEFEECATEKEQINVISDSFTYMIESTGNFDDRNRSGFDALGDQFKIILAFLKALVKSITLQFLSPRMVLFFHIYLYVTTPNTKFKKYLNSKENDSKRPPIVSLLRLLKKPLKHLIKKVIFAFFISLIMEKLIIPKIKSLIEKFVSKLKKEKLKFDKVMLEKLKPKIGK